MAHGSSSWQATGRRPGKKCRPGPAYLVCARCVHAGHAECWTWASRVSIHPACPRCHRPYQGGQPIPGGPQSNKDEPGVEALQGQLLQRIAGAVAKQDFHLAAELQGKLAGNPVPDVASQPKLGETEAKNGRNENQIRHNNDQQSIEINSGQ